MVISADNSPVWQSLQCSIHVASVSDVTQPSQPTWPLWVVHHAVWIWFVICVAPRHLSLGFCHRVLSLRHMLYSRWCTAVRRRTVHSGTAQHMQISIQYDQHGRILQGDVCQHRSFPFAISQLASAVCSTDKYILWRQELCRLWTIYVEQSTCSAVINWCFCWDFQNTTEDISV